MKASLVSATSLVALLAFEAGPAMAGPLVNLSDTAGTCSNTGGTSSCTMTFFALPGTASSQSDTVTATYVSANTLSFTVTFTKGKSNPPYSGALLSASINPPATVTSNAYNFTGEASAGSTGQSAAATGTFQVQVSNNTVPGTSQTSTVTLKGTTVAPIESTTNGDAGNVLVGTSQSTTVTVKNTGHGNLATGGASSTSNLNGSVASSSGIFSGSGGTLGGGTGLADSGSQTFTYAFQPTIRGATSTSVTANFSNGDPTGGNASNTVAPTITGTGVAPLESVAVTNAAGSGGGVANTGNLGNILVGQTSSATVMVSNTGDGNKDTKQPTSVSNLNGTVSVTPASPFSGTAGKSVSLNDSNLVGTPTTSSAFTYVYAPTTRSGGATQSLTVTSAFSNGSSQGANTGKNQSETVTSTISGVAVAPVDAGVTGGNAGFTLVNNNSKTAAVTVSNTGDGNKSGLPGSISNLNGTLGSGSGFFSGGPNPVSIGDTSSAAFNYVFTPTQIGASSTSVSANFSNGDSTGGNASHSTNATISGTGVAPIQNLSVSNSGNAGSTPGTGQVGYALVGVQTGTATINVLNSGNGNLDTSVSKAVSNLNGVVGASGSSVFVGGGGGLSLNDGTTQSTSYAFNPTTRGSSSTPIVTTFSNGSTDGKNLSGTVTTALSGQGVAPVESMSGSDAGFVLVGKSVGTGVAVNNTGDGNLSGLGSVSNLNGTISGPSGSTQFSGPSPNPNPLSLKDTSSVNANYVFAPTVRGADSATVTGNFSNGDATGGNASHTNTVAIAGTGVAPIANADKSAGAGFVLVGSSAGMAITITNSGDGNKSGLGSVSNLNGNAGSPAAGQFSGPSPNPNPLSMGDTSSTAVSYVFAPTIRGADSTNVDHVFSNGSPDGKNNATTLTTALSGQGVAPVESSAGGGAGFTLVGTSHSATVTVNNTGDGNKSGLGSVSNLNGTISGPSGSTQFAGPSPDPNPLSLKDTSSTGATYIFTPTGRGGDSATVTGNFSNGSADSLNASHTSTVTVTGQGVAPVQNTDASAAAGYVLVGTKANLSFTVHNTGDGNLDTSVATSVSNLNGAVGGPAGSAQFTGPSPSPNPLSLNDTSSTGATFQFAPTIRGADSSTVTTNFSNGNASGNNASDAATTTLTGQGVAPVNKVSSVSPVYARVGGTTATASITVANTGDGNLATGGPSSLSNLNGNISGPTGVNWSGSANTFSIQDNSVVAGPTSNTYNYTYSSQTPRGTSSSAAVTIGFDNGSSDSTNNTQTVNATLVGHTVGPVYKSSFHSVDNTAGARNAGAGTTSTIDWGTVGKTGSYAEFLRIANITTDANGGNHFLTDLSIESFAITGDPSAHFTIGGTQGPSGGLVPSVISKGGVEFIQIDFNAGGVAAAYTGLLTFQTDEDNVFGGLGNTYSYNLVALAVEHIPEPASVLLLSIGLGGVLYIRRRKSRGNGSGSTTP